MFYALELLRVRNILSGFVAIHSARLFLFYISAHDLTKERESMPRAIEFRIDGKCRF